MPTEQPWTTAATGRAVERRSSPNDAAYLPPSGAPGPNAPHIALEPSDISGSGSGRQSSLPRRPGSARTGPQLAAAAGGTGEDAYERPMTRGGREQVARKLRSGTTLPNEGRLRGQALPASM